MALGESWSVPRIWPDQTAVVLANGPSLSSGLVDLARNAQVKIVAINDAIDLAPDADWLHGGDPRFWRRRPDAMKAMCRIKTATQPGPLEPELLEAWRRHDIKIVQHRGRHNGIENDPRYVRGNNALAQVFCMMVHAGVDRLILLGADFRTGTRGRRRWHDRNPERTPYFRASLLPYMRTMVRPLEMHGVKVINATPNSHLDCFPIMLPEDALR